jgi:hypothetical protein
LVDWDIGGSRNASTARLSSPKSELGEVLFR